MNNNLHPSNDTFEDREDYFDACQKMLNDDVKEDGDMWGHTVDPYTIEQAYNTITLRNPDADTEQVKVMFEDDMISRGCDVEEAEEIADKMFKIKDEVDEDDSE